jgi:hypothetical protein
MAMIHYQLELMCTLHHETFFTTDGTNMSLLLKHSLVVIIGDTIRPLEVGFSESLIGTFL